MPKTVQKRAPSFPFYVRDWLVDLGEHPLEIEGAWIRFCAKAWLSKKRGVLTKKLTQWARFFGVDSATAIRILQYLQQEEIGEIFPHVTEALQKNNAEITVVSRRMVRDEKERENNRLRQKKYRASRNASRKNNGPVTSMKTLSSSSFAFAIKEKEEPPLFKNIPSTEPRNAKITPSKRAAPSGAELSKSGSDSRAFLTTKKGRKLTGKRLEGFWRFWDAFAYKKGRAEAADSWLDIEGYSDALVEEIIAGAKREAEIRPLLKAKNSTPKMAQGWLSARRWEDEDLLPPDGPSGAISPTALQTMLNAGPRRPTKNAVIRTETHENFKDDPSYTGRAKNYAQLKSGGKKGVV